MDYTEPRKAVTEVNLLLTEYRSPEKHFGGFVKVLVTEGVEVIYGLGEIRVFEALRPGLAKGELSGEDFARSGRGGLDRAFIDLTLDRLIFDGIVSFDGKEPRGLRAFTDGYSSLKPGKNYDKAIVLTQSLNK